jgi:hypothetical protein
MFSGQKERAIVSWLPIEDQRDLAWFWGPGQVAFERSKLGAQLDVAELFSFGSTTCENCRGSGFAFQPESVEKGLEAIKAYQAQHADDIAAGKMPPIPKWHDDGTCKRCNGFGRIQRDEPHRLSIGAWCHRCGEPEDIRDEDLCCPSCGGAWTRRSSALTAQPSGTEVRLLAEPYGDELERYGAVSHRLGKISDKARGDLGGFFCTGLRWADDKRLGQIFGVMPRTPAGKTLLRQSRKKTQNEDRLPDDVVLATEAELELTQPKRNRRELLEAARQQAELRLRSSEQEWIGVEIRRFEVIRAAAKPQRPPKPPLNPRPKRVVDAKLENVRRSLRIIEIQRVSA